MAYLVDQFGNPFSSTNPFPAKIMPSDPVVDGAAAPVIPFMLFNGSTYDLQRGNLQGTLFNNYAVNVATLNSSTQTNNNAKGVIISLEVKSITGTPTAGISLNLRLVLPNNSYNSGAGTDISLTTTGRKILMFYPGASGSAAGDIATIKSLPLPRQWAVQLVNNDQGAGTVYNVTVDYNMLL